MSRLAEPLADLAELPDTLIFDFPTLRQIEDHLNNLLQTTLNPTGPARHGEGSVAVMPVWPDMARVDTMIYKNNNKKSSNNNKPRTGKNNNNFCN